MTGLPAEIPERFSKHLIRSERVVVAVRRHPVQVVEPVLSAVLALAVVLWIQTRLSRDVPIIPDVLWLMWLAVLLRALWRLYEWSQDWFVVTDRRLMLNYGVLTRRVAMMPMAKVTDMSFNRSPLGRVLGYGEFVLESAGQEQALRSVPWLPNPDTLYRLICAELFGTAGDVEDVELDLPPVDDPRGPQVPLPSAPPPPREAKVWRGFRLGPGGDDDARGERYHTDVIQVGREGAPDPGWDDGEWDEGVWDEHDPEAGGQDGAGHEWDEEADAEDPDIEDPDIEDPDIEDPDIEDPGVEDPGVEDADVDDPGLYGQDLDEVWDDEVWDGAGSDDAGSDVAEWDSDPDAGDGGRRPRRRGVLGLWDRLDPLTGPASSARSGRGSQPGRRSQPATWWARLDPRRWRL